LIDSCELSNQRLSSPDVSTVVVVAGVADVHFPPESTKLCRISEIEEPAEPQDASTKPTMTIPRSDDRIGLCCDIFEQYNTPLVSIPGAS
jgi:hypothetical protein